MYVHQRKKSIKKQIRNKFSLKLECVSKHLKKKSWVINNQDENIRKHFAHISTVIYEDSKSIKKFHKFFLSRLAKK